jgi:transposase
MEWSGRAAALAVREAGKGAQDKEHAMSQKLDASPAVIGIDIGKNSFHIIGQNQRGGIVLRQKWSRGQVETRLANLPPCLIGMEACVGAHHLSRKLQTLGHDARLMPAKYVRPYSKGQKNDFRDAEAIAEAVQRPTMKFAATKTADQLDLHALHRVRERLVGQRTGVINQIRAFLLERGIAVRQGLRCLRSELPSILATRTDVLSPRMLRIIEDLAGDWRRLDERIEDLSSEIEALPRQDKSCERLMTVPGIGPIISSAMVAAIGLETCSRKAATSAPGALARRAFRYLRLALFELLLDVEKDHSPGVLVSYFLECLDQAQHLQIIFDYSVRHCKSLKGKAAVSNREKYAISHVLREHGKSAES